MSRPPQIDVNVLACKPGKHLLVAGPAELDGGAYKHWVCRRCGCAIREDEARWPEADPLELKR